MNTTAAELMEMLKNDPAHRAERARRDAEARDVGLRFRRESADLTKDLAEAGFYVDSVWSLSSKYPNDSGPFPILADHLTRDYPDEVLNAIAQHLANHEALPWWDTVSARYANAPGPASRQGLAAALSQIAGKAQVDTLIELASDDANGESRILLLRAINRLGGSRAKQFIKDHGEDPVLGRECTAVLRGKSRNE